MFTQKQTHRQTEPEHNAHTLRDPQLVAPPGQREGRSDINTSAPTSGPAPGRLAKLARGRAAALNPLTSDVAEK